MNTGIISDELNILGVMSGIEVEIGKGVCEDDSGEPCTLSALETTVHDKIYIVTLCRRRKWCE